MSPGRRAPSKRLDGQGFGQGLRSGFKVLAGATDIAVTGHNIDNFFGLIPRLFTKNPQIGSTWGGGQGLSAHVQLFQGLFHGIGIPVQGVQGVLERINGMLHGGIFLGQATNFCLGFLIGASNNGRGHCGNRQNKKRQEKLFHAPNYRNLNGNVN